MRSTEVLENAALDIRVFRSHSVIAIRSSRLLIGNLIPTESNKGDSLIQGLGGFKAAIAALKPPKPCRFLAMVSSMQACRAENARRCRQNAPRAHRRCAASSCRSASGMIRSSPGRCRCRRTSIRGTRRLQLLHRALCLSRRGPARAPIHAPGVALSVIETPANRSA